MISVVVLTHNEAHNIKECLASVFWADDIVVIDSGSTDGTPDLATRCGARVAYRKFDDFAAQRNWAIDEVGLKHEWVLHLDADERVSPELADELKSIATNGSRWSAYRVPFRLIFLGRPLKHCGMYPRYQVRFGKSGLLRFGMEGHGQKELLPADAVANLTGDLIHHNFSKGISDWVTKHARYARDEALAKQKSKAHGYSWLGLLGANSSDRHRALKALSYDLPCRPLVWFLYLYVYKLGFLDGRAGLRYSVLFSWYQWVIDLNREELRLLDQHER